VSYKLRAWLAAFIFTELVEVPIYWLGVPCSLLVAFGASAITHPIVWFGFFTPLWRATYLTKAICAELFAWLAESIYLRFAARGPKGARITLPRALGWSLIANTSSLGLGILSRHLFGVP
jgi:hypothetical protein